MMHWFDLLSRGNDQKRTGMVQFTVFYSWKYQWISNRQWSRASPREEAYRRLYEHEHFIHIALT